MSFVNKVVPNLIDRMDKSNSCMKKIISAVILSVLMLAISGCSGSKESYNHWNNSGSAGGGQVRVLLDEEPGVYEFTNDSAVYLKNGESYIALVNPGNRFSIAGSGDEVEVEIEGKRFKGKNMRLVPGSPEQSVSYKGGLYRGSINLIADGPAVNIVNQLSIEEYLKGVIPKEMPTGKGDEYYEALKAFTICARTYTFSKLKENKKNFDVFADTRDQVYGGSGIEKEIVNKVVDETRGLILTYRDKPAVTFYHSTCGGYTEDVKNVFPNMDLPYLVTVKDGDEPYCSISPKFTWTETFSEKTFVQRFVSAGYLDNLYYSVRSLNINSTFRSGRINELEIDFTGSSGNLKTIKLYGNNIRYIIRTANNKAILESNNFSIRRDGDNIIIKGKGYGHGVGLCQWGALEQSKEGRDFEEILSLYYPGTKIERYNDQ